MMGYIPTDKLNNPMNIDKVHSIVKSLEVPDILPAEDIENQHNQFDACKQKLIDLGETWMANNLDSLILRN